ncbi:MAG: hypothetical protein IJ201_04245 [Solobacterium sp.]|nr:hypothetical protein [Solobacterium sp.]
MKRYLSKMLVAMALAVLFSACANRTGSTVTNEPAAEPAAQPAQAAEVPEETPELRLTVRLQDAPQEEQNFRTSDRETAAEFHNLFEELLNAEDGSDDVPMKDDGFDAVMDGILSCDNRSIAYLRDTLHWHKDAYENAMYLELREETDGNTAVYTLILPEESRYSSRLEALAEAVQKEN